MDYLNFLEPIFKDEIVQFFILLALLQILAQVFVDRRVAFWIASLSATYLWIKQKGALVPLKAWFLILSVLSVYLLTKTIFHFNIFLFLKGKKRCPQCFQEVHWRAKVCPFCKYHFKKMEIGEEVE